MEWSFWPNNSFLVKNRLKSAFLGQIFQIFQIFKTNNYILKFVFGSKLTKMDNKCKKCQDSLKSAFFGPFFALFCKLLQLSKKTVHYLILKFCRNLRHSKGLSMEWSFWPGNSFWLKNWLKQHFCPNFSNLSNLKTNLFEILIFFLVQN